MLLGSKHAQATCLQRPGLHSNKVLQRTVQGWQHQVALQSTMRLSTAVQQQAPSLQSTSQRRARVRSATAPAVLQLFSKSLQS